MSKKLIQIDGKRVSIDGEMVSLTGLWKAAGSDPSRQPSNWLASANAKRFIEALDVLEPGNSGVQSKKGGRGVGGSTFAHWQIAMNYARYLDPAFAVRCNEIVRAHMEKKLSPVSEFPTELLEMVRRTDGIVRMLANKVTKIERAVIDGSNAAGGGAAFTITVEPKRVS